MRLQPLSNIFPLYSYAEPSARATVKEADEQPEVWADAYDALSVYWITRFQLHSLPHKVKLLQTPDSAPGGEFPALLCLNGDLLSAQEVPAWFDRHMGEQQESLSKQTSDDERAWCTLFEQKLMPAWLATLYSEPVFSQWSASRLQDRPALSQIMLKLLASKDQHLQLAHLRDLLHCTSTSDAVILEDLDAEARKVLDAAKTQLEASSTRWLLGSQQPTRADAWLAAYLRLFISLGDLPSTELSKPYLYTYIHRTTLKPLLDWYQGLDLKSIGDATAT